LGVQLEQLNNNGTKNNLVLKSNEIIDNQIDKTNIEQRQYKNKYFSSVE